MGVFNLGLLMWNCLQCNETSKCRISWLKMDTVLFPFILRIYCKYPILDTKIYCLRCYYVAIWGWLWKGTIFIPLLCMLVFLYAVHIIFVGIMDSYLQYTFYLLFVHSYTIVDFHRYLYPVFVNTTPKYDLEFHLCVSLHIWDSTKTIRLIWCS